MSKSLQTLARSMGGIPTSYLGLDTETTGFDGHDDLIWNIGTCLVIEGSVVERWDQILNWADHPFVDRRWLESRINYTTKQMASAGRVCHASIGRLQEGVKPEDAMEALVERMEQARRVGIPILGHGFIRFDALRICRHLKEYLGLRWRFDKNRIIDTGAIEKAIESGWMPKPKEAFYDYSRRVLNRPSSHKWNLDTHCLNKYDLVARYDLDELFLHTAGADAYVCHLLLQTYQQILAEYESHDHAPLPATAEPAATVRDDAGGDPKPPSKPAGGRKIVRLPALPAIKPPRAR